MYVTHDQIEAMTLGQRVAVLRDGVLQQVDTPQRLFREPANLFVASFIGSPSMNLVEATTNLSPPTVWHVIATNQALAPGPWRYTNENTASFPWSFFRVRIQ